jgi:hypothetical protein
MNADKSSASMERPIDVLCAVQMGFTSLVLALIVIPFRHVVIKPQLLGFVILAIIFISLFITFLLIMILRGQNWARLLFIILFFLWLPVAFPGIIVNLQKGPLPALISLTQLFMQMMATVLLLQQPARNWFKSMKLRKLMNYQVT